MPPPLPDYGIDTILSFITFVLCIMYACTIEKPMSSNKINMHMRPDTTKISKKTDSKHIVMNSANEY